MKSPAPLFLALGLLTIADTASAQVYTPPSGGGSQPSSGGNNTTIVNRQQPQGQRQVAGNDMPWLDPATNVFQFDGKTFNVMDNHIFRARFEKFLNSPEASTESDQAYQGAIQEILDLLSPHNNPNPTEAYVKLQVAAQFSQDAKLCDSLANAIYRVWLASKSVTELQRLNTELESRRKKLDWNYDQWKDAEKLSEGPRQVGRGGQQQQQQQSTKPDNAGHIQRYIQRIAEVEATRVANKAKMELSEIESKLEFQSLIVQFFLQRRFQHVIMGARFYTEFFQDGNGRLQFEEGSDVEQAFAKSIGFNPTITTLDAFANEALRDVEQQVQSFDFLLEQGRTDGAARQLQQAFVMGEYLPVVQSIPRTKKVQVSDYVLNSFQLVNAIEVKDYTLAEELVNKMKAQASDFDYSKPTAAIGGAKLASMMRIRTAKNAALEGKNDVFEENIKAAAEIWPTNPMLKQEFGLLSDAGDVRSQAKLEFDRLLSTQSYRQIFDDKARFIAATVDDTERQDALNQIVNNILEIETSIKQADSLVKNGNAHAAWELIEKTFQKFPDDVPLSAKRSDLSTEVAEFVRALKTAENLENRDQTGSSLAWFLKAQRMYPLSDFASEGIDRLVNRILPDEAGSGFPETSGGDGGGIGSTSAGGPDDGFGGDGLVSPSFGGQYVKRCRRPNLPPTTARRRAVRRAIHPRDRDSDRSRTGRRESSNRPESMPCRPGACCP